MITNTFTRKFNREVGKPTSLTQNQTQYIQTENQQPSEFVSSAEFSRIYHMLNERIENLFKMQGTITNSIPAVAQETPTVLGDDKIIALEEALNRLEKRLSELETAVDSVKNSNPINNVNYENIPPAPKKPARRGIRAKTPSDDVLS
jgi:hypothetical protein